MEPEEATVKPNGKISLNNWFRFMLITFALIITMAGAITSYAYVIVIPTMSQKIDQNIQRIADLNVAAAKLEVLETKLDFIIDDMDEFKAVLRRSVPMN